ncbi:conserved hypothetical protein [delta proteobacterium NaphS2]|nr:conserved hypothetical protein [delta proteobacterium NaphS2]
MITMMGLKELKENGKLVDSIDWSMTPEEAVRLYLEWGNNWSRGYEMVRSKDDKAHYFVLNTWEASPLIYFIERDYEGAVELAKIEVPEQVKNEAKYDIPSARGVFAVDGELQLWLKKELDVA